MSDLRPIRAGELRIGDTIRVWWSPQQDTVTAIEPYTGPLASLWPGGARILRFALLRGGMTVGNDDVEALVCRAHGKGERG